MSDKTSQKVVELFSELNCNNFIIKTLNPGFKSDSDVDNTKSQVEFRDV